MFFDKPETQERISDTGALGEPATFLDRTKAAFDAARDRNAFQASGLAITEAYDARIKAIRDATGADLANPMRRVDTRTPSSMSQEGFGLPSDPVNTDPLRTTGSFEFEFQKELERLAEKHPDKRDIIAPHKPVRQSLAKEVGDREQRSIDAGRNYGGTFGTGPIADFAGGMGAAAVDPVNAATFLIGPTGRVAQGYKAILAMGVKQGIANAGVEAAMAPLVQDFRRQMGLSYGVSEAAMDIAAAGALGFGADTIIRSGYRGMQRGLGRKAIVDRDGAVTGYESAEASAARAKRDAEARLKAEQLKALQDDGTLAKAMEDDQEAIAKVDQILGLSEDPAVRGAMQARSFVEMEPGELDGIVKQRNLEQALRAAMDAEEPPPVIRLETPSRRPSLSDEMEIPKGTEGNQHFRTIDIDGKPVRLQNIDPKSLTTDAEAFQFKSGGDARGVTGALGLNTTFDPAAAGRVMVFERGDGVMVIVDGHQRLSIAKDGDQFQGFVFREADGWTPDEVRAEAALKNIQEGRAGLLDAVRAVREHGSIMEGRLDDDTDFMRQVMALSRLSDSALARVEVGTIEPSMAALVGELVPDQAKHDGVIQALMRANPSTEAAARKVIGREIREPVRADELSQVMGASIAEPHVIEARTDVLAGALTALRESHETQAVAKVISRLADRPGLVADTLNQAGRAVAEGQPIERAIDATLRRFEQVIAEAGVKGLAEKPVRLASISADEPVRLAALSDVSTGRSMRADLDKLGYYSKALEAAKSWPQTKGTPEQAVMWLKKSGVKDAEIEATKVSSAFTGKKSVTRDEIVKHLTENRVGVNERIYGQRITPEQQDALAQQRMDIYRRWESGGMDTEAYQAADRALSAEQFKKNDPVKWQNYSLDPSNPTYRETVLHLPTPERVTLEEFAKAERKIFPDASDAEIRSAWDGMTYRTREKHIRDINTDFQSGHFSEPNIIGHMMTSMTKHEGRPVYTIDQIQSDWGQKLRDGGVRDEAKIAELKAKREEAKKAFEPLFDQLEALARDGKKYEPGNYGPLEQVPFYHDAPSGSKLTAEAKAIDDQLAAISSRISMFDAEYRTAQAAASGHPLVNTTDQWTNTTLRRALRQAVEADAEFIAIPHGDTVLSYNPGDEGGMRGFYGSRTSEGIVPKNLRKLLEKFDKDAAKPTLIDKLETPTSGMKGKGFTLFPLTDKVKRTIMEEGQPLFAKQDATQAVDQKALQDFSDNLESVLREAQQPSPPRLVSDVKDAKAHTEELRETMAQEIKEAVDPVTAEAARLAAIRAFHGSPHDFDRFDMSKIGTGEGAQAYGHGLYFAESEGVARFYQESLGDYKDSVKWKGDKPPTPMQESLIGRLMGPDVRSGSMMTVQKLRRELNYGLMDATDGMFPDAKRAQRYRAELAELDKIEPMIEVTPPGRMYEVSIKADPEDFLDWDKPLSQQSEKVRAALEPAVRGAFESGRYGRPDIDPMALKGSDFAEAVSQYLAANGNVLAARDKASPASKFMRDAGIPGIRYLDQGSRGAGEGSRNYVVFDDNLVEIVAKDGKPITPDQKKTILASMREEQAAERAARQQPAMIDPSKPLLYTPEANARQAEIRKEIDRTLQMLPPDVRIRVEDQLVFSGLDAPDQRIAGLWDGYDRLVYVAMSGADPVRAIRHEVIHALKQSKLLTDDEFNQLYAFAEKLKLRKAYGIDSKYRDLYTKAYGERGGDYVESLLREEVVAEMFADYSINGRRFGDVAGGGLVDRLIDRIVAFMKVMRDNLGFIGFKNINDIFQSIESGEVAARPSPRNPAGGRNPDVVARQIGEAMGGERLASSPLDLSPEARKARAEQMGFDTSTVYYHGTSKDFEAFDLSQFGVNTMTQKETPAIFFASSPKVASGYAEGWGGQSRDGANVRPVYIKTSNLDEWDLGGGALTPSLLKQAISEAKDDGRDGVIFRRALDMARQVAPGGAASRSAPDIVAVFDPSNIRSVNAEFDPAKSGSANLLASMEGQRPSEMLDQALAALPEETSTAIRNLLRQANIDEAQLGGMLDQLMPMIRSGDQQALAARVQDMAQEAQQAMPLPDTPFARDLASVRSDMEMTEVIGICRI